MQPGSQFGRFEVQQTLGQGGIAMVYRVRHMQLDSVLALKVLRVGDPATHHRLLQEGRIQAQLKHDNVVQVMDVVEHDGGIGLLMEYVDGFSLDECLLDGAMELPDAMDIFRQVLAGVAAAHAKGVTHRDLKPGNILLTTRRERVVAKVTDFGIAKVLADDDDGSGSATRAGIAMGTPGYMAPEQIADSSGVDLRADIFALGAILYEMLSGRRPFEGGTALDVLNATVRGEYDPLDTLVQGLPDDVVATVHRALSLRRADRFESCEALAEALFDDTGFLPRSSPPASLERIDDLPTAGGAPTLAPMSEEPPSQETWLPKAFATQAENTEENDVVETPTAATAAGQDLGYEVVEEERSAPLGTLGAGGSLRRDEIGGADEDAEGEDDDPDSDVNARDAAEMMGDLVWSFMRATAWGLAQTVRYGGIPIVIIFGISAWIGTQTAGDLAELADARRIEAESLANAMDSSVRLVPEIIAAGGNAELLTRLQQDYEQATTPEEKAAAARELSTALSQELARLPPPGSVEAERRRKEIGVVVHRLDREAVEYGEANARYEALADSAKGSLAQVFGDF